MSDIKTFTVSGTDTEIKDIISIGANSLDDKIVNEEMEQLKQDSYPWEVKNSAADLDLAPDLQSKIIFDVLLTPASFNS